VNYALFFLATFGLAFVIGHSKISLPLRTLLDPGNKIETFEQSMRWWTLELLECPPCVSWHLGLWYGLLGPSRGDSRVLEALILAFAATAVSFILGVFTGLIHAERD